MRSTEKPIRIGQVYVPKHHKGSGRSIIITGKLPNDRWTAGLNPRWALWMLSRGEDPAGFQLAPDGEPVLVPDEDGHLLPRALAFSLWVRARWAEWAAELGFTRSSGGSYPHEVAQQCGHTAGQFDAWLERKVRGSAEKGLDDVEG